MVDLKRYMVTFSIDPVPSPTSKSEKVRFRSCVDLTWNDPVLVYVHSSHCTATTKEAEVQLSQHLRANEDDIGGSSFYT